MSRRVRCFHCKVDATVNVSACEECARACYSWSSAPDVADAEWLASCSPAALGKYHADIADAIDEIHRAPAVAKFLALRSAIMDCDTAQQDITYTALLKPEIHLLTESQLSECVVKGLRHGWSRYVAATEAEMKRRQDATDGAGQQE